MADRSSLEEAWRRAMDLNIRYYTSIGRLAVDYWKELITTVSDLGGVQTAAGRTAATAQWAPQSAPSRASAGTIVLEAEAGAQAIGVFLVHNHLDRRVTAKVEPSTFADENGNQIKPHFEFDPEVVNLEPKEQILVHARVTIERSMTAGNSYRGELVIPELIGTKVPVVVRRRPAKGKPRGGQQ